ncbi:GntR family transcriptional regulator [Amycolatopsis pithecellobii]|uniref:FCD domain-containing protein n=1 Tax=Amycolatopsis pithecellobii TaxID=664692 RepID=A0A6N7Z3W0_9PSEU|nr:GntR family transcriptional regulator [Amycolatopsis pithecellobii]MTD53736.1 FCD domain-containing protein [Amycolatopsis pithecellobii]
MTQRLLPGAAGKQRAADGLRTSILNGDMVPGQRLVEADLVELYAVTRSSVRDAIDDLISEGLVERVVNKGARVRVVSLDEAISILECRGVLEGLIAARAAQRITKKGAAELRAIGRRMERAVADGELLTYSRLNSQLHARIAELSGQQTASNLIHRLRSQIVRHQFQLSLRPGRPPVSLKQHLEIIDAVASSDPVRAERAARAHLESVIDALGTAPSV